MGWIYLSFAIIFELTGTTLMKLSDGMTKVMPAIGVVISYILCFGLMAVALKTIEMGVAYAVWSAVGIVVLSFIGIIFFKESVSVLKIASIIFIVIGVIGLNLSGTSH